MENIKRIDEKTIEVDGIVYKAEKKMTKYIMVLKSIVDIGVSSAVRFAIACGLAARKTKTF